MKRTVGLLLALGMVGQLGAHESDGLVGVIPAAIADLKADVGADGHIRVRGRGLLLASGNSIGQNASQSVFATPLGDD